MRLFICLLWCFLTMAFGVEAHHSALDIAEIAVKEARHGEDLLHRFGIFGKRRHSGNYEVNSEKRRPSGNRDSRDAGRNGFHPHKRGNELQKSSNHSTVDGSRTSAETLIPRASLFPDNEKSVCLSHSGRFFAYVAIHGERESVHLLPTNGESAAATVICEGGSRITRVFFGGGEGMGEWLVYTYRDENNHVKLTLVDMETRNRKCISPTNDAVSVDVRTGRDKLRVISNNGNEWSIHMLGVPDGRVLSSSKGIGFPPTHIVDDNLDIKLICHREKGFPIHMMRVFMVNGMMEKKVMEDADVRQTRYVAATDDRCWKLCMRGRNAALVQTLCETNMSRDVVVVDGVAELSDCEVLREANGEPWMMVVRRARWINIPVCNWARRHVENLNHQFGNGNWRLESVSSDRKVWLICIMDPGRPDRYYVYDTKTGNGLHMTTSATSFRMHLPTTACVQIPTRDGFSIIGYLTRKQPYLRSNPLVVVDFDGGCSWRYSPIVHLLVNRGCNVLCVNCRSDHTDEANDLEDAVRWCCRRGLVESGQKRVGLMVFKKRAYHALQLISKNPENIGFLVLISPKFVKTKTNSVSNVVNQVRLPMLVVMSSQRDGTVAQSLTGSPANTPITLATYNQKPSSACIAALVEGFIAKISKLSRTEAITSKELSEFSFPLDRCNLKEQNSAVGGSDQTTVDEDDFGAL